MQIKAGVDVAGITPELILALIVIEGIYKEVTGKGLVITSLRDGKHKSGSKHYVGLAADLRTNVLTASQVVDISARVKESLGAQYDFVLETDHFHVEFDPKVPL